MINQSEITTYETKEQAEPACPAANQASVEANRTRLKANHARLTANPIRLKANHTRLTAYPIRSAAYPTGLETDRTSLEANPVRLMTNRTLVTTNPIRLEAKSIRLPANRMYQGMSLRRSKATEAISTIQIQEIAALTAFARNDKDGNGKRIINHARRNRCEFRAA